jgi:uncharacterized protein YcaQ
MTTVPSSAAMIEPWLKPAASGMSARIVAIAVIRIAARIDGYRRAWTDAYLYQTRDLYETYNKGLSIVPTRELPWYRVAWDESRLDHDGAAFDEHAPLVEELLARIQREGPLAATDVEPRAAIEWYWRPTNQVRALLEALAEAGVLGLARRDGNRLVYDLIERLFPATLLAQRPDAHEQRRHKLLSRYRAHGLLGRSGSAELWIGTAPAKRLAGAADAAVDPDRPTRGELLEELVEDGSLRPVAVEGVRGERFVLAAEVALLEAAGRPDRLTAEEAPPGVAFLAPLDPFVWDGDLLRAPYDFDYVWEVYVPAAKRRWGYYVLPVLFGDRLVGRIEPRFDRRAGSLRVLHVVGGRLRSAGGAGLRRGNDRRAGGSRALRRRWPDRPAPNGPPPGPRRDGPGPAREWRPDQGVM